jgi:pteridine reductase
MPNKLALITGSGRRRVGNCVARRLARHGYDIALHYNRSADDARQTADELRSLGVRVELYRADVAREAEVEGMFDEVRNAFGRIDLLVASAAVWRRKSLDDTTAADVMEQFAVNTLGTFLCCRRAGLMMVEQPDGGAIVAIGDWASARPYPDYAAYHISKGSIPTMTRMFAIELARRNPRVRVNCILPGPVMAPENLSEHELKGAVAGTLLKRLGSPENVAQVVLMLAENDYITGVCLPVDGGRTIAG